jgi:hypothetical protein
VTVNTWTWTVPATFLAAVDAAEEDGAPEVTEVRARALTPSSSKMRAAAIAFHLSQIAKLNEANAAEVDDVPAVPVAPPSRVLPQAPPVWMTVAEYALHRKASDDTIRRAIARGMPASGSNKQTRIDRSEADRWWK